jgi:hypothetical protein
MMKNETEAEKMFKKREDSYSEKNISVCLKQREICSRKQRRSMKFSIANPSNAKTHGVMERM